MSVTHSVTQLVAQLITSQNFLKNPISCRDDKNSTTEEVPSTPAFDDVTPSETTTDNGRGVPSPQPPERTNDITNPCLAQPSFVECRGGLEHLTTPLPADTHQLGWSSGSVTVDGSNVHNGGRYTCRAGNSSYTTNLLIQGVNPMIMEPNLTGNDSTQTVSTGDALFFNVSVNIWPSSRAQVSVRISSNINISSCNELTLLYICETGWNKAFNSLFQIRKEFRESQFLTILC
eukprot:sb/3469386/